MQGTAGDCRWPGNLHRDTGGIIQLNIQVSLSGLFTTSDELVQSSLSPVEVDHNLGALLMMCGLCTAPCHGELCSTEAVRRRKPGEAKGLPMSGGVNGAVRGLYGPPIMERAKTEPGVFIRNVGLGLIRSSALEVTLKGLKEEGM